MLRPTDSLKVFSVVTYRSGEIRKSDESKGICVNAIAKIVAVAVLWGVTGMFAAVGLQAFLGVDSLIFSCGSLSIAIGMGLLQIATLSEEGRNMFYEGTKPDGDYLNLGVVFLWGTPFILLILGTLWWLFSQLAS